MDITAVTALLNEQARALYRGKIARGDGFLFYSGNAAEKFKEVLLSAAPCGKVLLLFDKSGFAAMGKILSAAAESAGCKPFCVVVEEGYDFIKAASGALCAPEEIRLVAVCGRSMLKLGAYCARIRGVPLAVIQTSVNTCGVLSPHVFFKNGDKPDVFRAEIKRHIIFDEDAIAASAAADTAEAYLDTESRIPALTDYRIACVIKGERAAKEEYSLAREAILAVYNIFGHGKEDRAALLLYNGMLSELANAGARGKLFDFSALSLADEMFFGGRAGGGLKLRMYSVISGIYYLYFDGKFDKITEYPDYLARADEISARTGTDKGVILSGLRKQAAVLNKSAKKIRDIKDRLKAEIISQNASASAVSAAYYALGGKGGADEKEAALAVKHCGDLPFGINGITLAREEGFTEYL